MQTVPDQSTQAKVTTTPDANPYNLQDWQKGYRSLKQEHDYWIDDIEGEIPTDLQGTLFRNGPGLLDVNGQRIHHPFDGDGMISAIAFKDGRAHYRNRFVRTEGFVAEQAAQKILYRGVFGTQKPGGWLANAFDFRLKNIANTNVVYWGDKLMALWEAAEPHRLDPNMLDTLGLEYLNGTLQPGSAFSAHPRFDPACADDGSPRMVNFAIKTGLSSTITIYELDLTGQVVRQHSHSVPGFAFVHDFVITPNYCIFFQNPVTFNPLPFAVGLRGAGECITFRADQPTQIIVIPRYTQEPVQILPAESGFVFHHANAFEQDGNLYVDSICYAKLPVVEPEADYLKTKFDALEPGQLWRFTINLAAKTVQWHLVEPRCCEFPTLHPQQVGRPYRYLYIGAAHSPLGNAPLQGILKLDLETGNRQLWSAAPWGYAGEPVFVPRPNADPHVEDDGWLLALFFNAKLERSELVILDAGNLNREPIARLRLKHHVPYGLHGSFTPTVFGI
ncbi:carotenoid oxygenase family protein [Oscillatoria sp. FACHB-1407]|uniref:carotenoid oxygenase family protein n=1 Tax=Oscillatoria sp. FACHB-1407 TaxID=2692847 RepID=UPI00168580BA|nr:carotenoid oxygenase family protein [Oscillatoria sp. FACHB-1407]MBD2462386.1 carotenoid oxygenase family protein [Oscillatoria sp. FACHB-1407]